MLKRIKLVCFTLVIVMLTSIMPVAVSASSFWDVPDNDYYTGSVERLSSLEIINGFADGSFWPEATLTRAQFAKIIVCALDKQDEANVSSASSAFWDVNANYWGTPYINYVANNGIIIGYADGSFQPEKPITYAEALTILLRMVGYDENKVGYYWPTNYIDKANSLGITYGINIEANSPITRAVGAMIVDASLFSEYNASKNDGKTQVAIEKLGYTVIEDAIVLSTSEEDANLPEKNIKLSDNSIYEYKTNDKFTSASLLKYVVLDEDNFIVAVKDNLSGDKATAEMRKLGYTVLNNCHIIASAAEDRNISSSEVRTSYGVYTTQTSDILSSVGEVGTVILNKDKKIISFGTHDAPYQEYIISEVDGNSIEYVTENTLSNLNLDSSFPIYVDYSTKKEFANIQSDFVAGAELTMYKSANDGDWEFGVLDTNAGYSILNDCFIVATKAEDKSLTADQVRTSNGVYKVKNTEILANAGSMGTVVVGDNSKIEQFAPTNMESLNAVVNKVNSSEIEYLYSNGNKSSFKFDNTFVVYEDYNKSTYAQAKNSISVGTDITFYGSKYNDWEFVVIESNDDIDPILVSKNYTDSDTSIGGIAIDKSNLVVYRNGESSSLSNIQRNDVVYYNTKTNTMDVYNKKVTGIYSDALPSKAYVTTVKVGGKEYTIGNTIATTSLDASTGSFAIGDKVTLLLGKNDEVVFAVELTDFDYFDYGIVVNTGKSIIADGDDEGRSQITAKVFMPDGNIYEYVTNQDYKSYKGVLVKLQYNDGVVSMTRVSTSSKVYGDIDFNKRTIDGKTFLKDGAIMQLISNNDGEDAQVELLNFDTLDVSKITSSSVLNSITANKFGDLAIMVVEGVTSSSYDFGMLVGVNSSGGTNSYKVYCDGTKTTYTSGSKYSVNVGTPVAIKIANGQITDMFNLYSIQSGSIDAVEGGRIMISNNIYKLSDSVVIYGYKNNEYSNLTIDDLDGDDIGGVTIYSDKSKSNNGAIRVILVSLK